VARGASAVGRLVHQLHPHQPAVADVAALFRGTDGDAARHPGAVARRIAALRYRNRAMVALVGRRGLGVLSPLVEDAAVRAIEAVANRGRPTILLGWHLGAACGLAAALTSAQARVLAIRRDALYVPAGGLDLTFMEGDAAARARAVRQALQRLKAGGVLAVAADVADVSLTEPVACLGHAIRLSRGPFMLARVSGADVIPVVPRWTAADRITVHVGDPLVFDTTSGASVEAIEQDAAVAAARWLESYLVEHPDELWVYSLAWLLAQRA
jgi:lauroyl/myristoyl acyltransferase